MIRVHNRQGKVNITMTRKISMLGSEMLFSGTNKLDSAMYCYRKCVDISKETKDYETLSLGYNFRFATWNIA